eukprot:TRINITY_DN4343_c0_g1_i1.p1 TRINITY_DN4343_c0_g1~~TRINITY_DN4343_c0_g1_i1.p1  ORF type:complete len:812 (-),score=184.62 TRINITY_DN4343_c0_g1_i1:98-2533(-)
MKLRSLQLARTSASQLRQDNGRGRVLSLWLLTALTLVDAAAAAVRAAALPPAELRADFASHGSDWGQASCGSRKSQSPVNLNEIFRAPTDFFTFEYNASASGATFSLFNDGRTIEADVSGLGLGGMALPSDSGGAPWYRLKTIRVHALSEHTLRGQRTPLEVQLIHEEPTGSSAGRELVAVSILVDCPDPPRPPEPEAAAALLQNGAGKAGLRGLQQRGKSFRRNRRGVVYSPPASGDAAFNSILQLLLLQEPPILGEQITVSDAVPSFDGFLKGGTYFMYRGSDTLPPCEERVVWLVRRESVMASNAQVNALFSVLYDTTNGAGNYRTIMPLNGRVIDVVESMAKSAVKSKDAEAPGYGDPVDAITKEARAITAAAEKRALELERRYLGLKVAASTSGVPKAVTTLATDHVVGMTELFVDSTAGFTVGDLIAVGQGAMLEQRIITGFGSILLDKPLVNAHPVGTEVRVLAEAGSAAALAAAGEAGSKAASKSLARQAPSPGLAATPAAPSPSLVASPGPSPMVGGSSQAIGAPSPGSLAAPSPGAGPSPGPWALTAPAPGPGPVPAPVPVLAAGMPPVGMVPVFLPPSPSPLVGAAPLAPSPGPIYSQGPAPGPGPGTSPSPSPGAAASMLLVKKHSQDASVGRGGPQAPAGMGSSAPDAAFATADAVAQEVQKTIQQAVRQHLIPAAEDLARSYVRQEFLHRAGFTTPMPQLMPPPVLPSSITNPTSGAAAAAASVGAAAAVSSAQAPSPAPMSGPAPAPAAPLSPSAAPSTVAAPLGTPSPGVAAPAPSPSAQGLAARSPVPAPASGR